MSHFRIALPICLLATAALAQQPAPKPAPVPAGTAMPAVPPEPPVPPEPAVPPEPPEALGLGSSYGGYLADFADDPLFQDKIQEKLAEVQEKMAFAQDHSLMAQQDQIQEKLREAQEKLAYSQDSRLMALQAAASVKERLGGLGLGSGLGLEFAQRIYGRTAADSLYERGQNALENQRWEQALDAFNEVVARAGARADGALYWKAYALNRLGRRDEALGAIAELRKSHAGSRWLDDAKALEILVKQFSGQPVAPENQSDDQLKLLALNGLVQTDPDRAFPILENLLKGAQSPQLKKNAIFVLAQNSSPRAQQLLEQIARGGAANPDLQLVAISYMGRTDRQTSRGQLFFDIYGASSDPAVKRATLNALAESRDKDHLSQIAKTEKDPDLRLDAIRRLGSTSSQAELWQLYQAETTPEVKQQILEMISASGSTDKLIDVARNEKDAKLRRLAIRSLGSARAASSSDALVSIYNSDQDAQIKRTIIDTLCGQRNAKALIELGRKEQNMELRKEIVTRLVGMKSPEATDFLMEILK